MTGKLSNNLEFVKQQAMFHQERANQFAGQARAKKHQETADKFVELSELIRELSVQSTQNDSEGKSLRLQLTHQELHGLPDELLDELSVSKTDNRIEYLILNLLDDLGGIASLDQIIVGLYHETEEIHKRPAVTNRLYRMASKDLVYSVPDKKGVYSLQPLQPGDLDKILQKSREKAKAELALPLAVNAGEKAGEPIDGSVEGETSNGLEMKF